jgi:hypothetical protein
MIVRHLLLMPTLQHPSWQLRIPLPHPLLSIIHAIQVHHHISPIYCIHDHSIANEARLL